MARTFAYARVSTTEQDCTNQIREIEAAGFKIEEHRFVTEVVSGSSACDQRKGFQKLLERMERDDILVVCKLDRLGRNAIDVMQTVNRLAKIGVRTHCLALGGCDLTSSAGKMIMHVISAMSQFEKDLLIERTLSGQARAKAAGKKFGRPPALVNGQVTQVLERLAAGETISAVARTAGTSRATILRLKTAAVRETAL
jgi:putative DNA-invertase from lambdoid prophage Rac